MHGGYEWVCEEQGESGCPPLACAEVSCVSGKGIDAYAAYLFFAVFSASMLLRRFFYSREFGVAQRVHRPRKGEFFSFLFGSDGFFSLGGFYYDVSGEKGCTGADK